MFHTPQKMYAAVLLGFTASPPSLTFVQSVGLVELNFERRLSLDRSQSQSCKWNRILRFFTVPDIQCLNVAFPESNVGGGIEQCDVDVVGVRANDVEGLVKRYQ
jgi:hypothetical protein